MKDELRINGKDAYTTWGISMDNNALSELMTPSSNKTFIENESRLEHGKRAVRVGGNLGYAVSTADVGTLSIIADIAYSLSV